MTTLMEMLLTWIHDQVVLQSVLKWYYPYIWVWAVLLLPALLLLPGHRRVTQVTLVTLAVWHLMCLVLWGMFRQAPVAAWVILAALSLRLGIMLWHLIPQGWFSSWLLRFYLRADPRCVHLFDLARARRGLMNAREPADRLAVREQNRGIVRLTLAIMERLTRVVARLPRFWRLPHVPLTLDQPHVHAVLQEERRRLEERFVQDYHQTSLEDFRRMSLSRRVDYETAIEHDSQRLIALIEAVAEYLSFHQPMPPGCSEEKWNAYLAWARAWRFRRQYDGLWFGWDTGKDAKDADDELRRLPDADTEVDTQKADDAERSSLLHPFASAATDLAEAPVDDRSTSTRTEADLASDVPLDGYAEAAEAEHAPGVEKETSDEELLDLAIGSSREDVQPDVVAQANEAALSPPDAARNADVIEACACLESELGLKPAVSLEAGLRSVRPKYADKRTRATAFHLLIMYCARLDWTGAEADRARIDVVDGLWSDFVGSAKAEKRSSDTRRAAQSVLVDLMMSRHEYARVRGLYTAADSIGRATHELLAEACAGLARQVSSAPELRDMLLFEAIDHYFQAGHRGIWRKELAQRIIWEVRTQKDVLDILDAFAVHSAQAMSVTLTAAPIRPPKKSKITSGTANAKGSQLSK